MPSPPDPTRSTPTTIDVYRAEPPEYGACRDVACQRQVEWVVTTHDRRMPIDRPLRVLDAVQEQDGRTRVTIPASSSHFVTCPAASAFRKRAAQRTANNPRVRQRNGRKLWE